MMEGDLLTVIIVVATALVFDFTNGFHDTANVVATSISTRAMSPRIAVGFAAVLNFAGAFISLEVAATIAEDVVDPLAITTTVIPAGLRLHHPGTKPAKRTRAASGLPLRTSGARAPGPHPPLWVIVSAATAIA